MKVEEQFLRHNGCGGCKLYHEPDDECYKRRCWGVNCKDPYAIDAYEPSENALVAENPVTDKPSTRRVVLDQAIQCVCTDRDTQYGSPEDSFKAIAELWEVYMRDKRVGAGADLCILPEDVGIMMALLKIGRIATGHYKLDNYVDAAGYLACAAECHD